MEDTLTLRPDIVGNPFKRAWSFGFNTCHAPIVMRTDVQEHMREAGQLFGMRYWRCHGTLSDDVGIVLPGRDGEPDHYAFSGLKRILDAGLAAGVKPFFELSFMPKALARDPKPTITWYRGHTSPPGDWDRWSRLIDHLVAWLLATYGRSEIDTWYFEVWNEPNIGFWAGTQEEYFELYARAARALKAACPTLRVGGPATARAAWVADLLDYCKDNDVPCDFISTHIYPNDVAFVEGAEGETKRLGMDFMVGEIRRVHREVTERRPGLPVFWGEWNSSAGPLVPNHDTCGNAAAAVAGCSAIEAYADGSLWWNLSDVYEEPNYHFAPFHGGYGLFTVDNLIKSAGRGFELLHGLPSHQAAVEGLPDTWERGALFGIDPVTGHGRLILWHCDPPEADNPTAPESWQCTVRGLPGNQPCTLTAILPEAGSACETWERLGAPTTLTPDQEAQLRGASLPHRERPRSPGERLTLEIPPGTVWAIDFSPSRKQI
ncbi:MAG: GH39 family glycosyl hydrolase [Opitutales bacterium]